MSWEEVSCLFDDLRKSCDPEKLRKEKEERERELKKWEEENDEKWKKEYHEESKGLMKAVEKCNFFFS